MATTGTHTPGPWVVEITRAGGVDVYYDVIAPRGWQEPNGEYKRCMVAPGLDSEADAHLIAAAPETAAERDRLQTVTTDLLTALEMLIGKIERDERIIMRDLTPGRAAIRAARGEG